MLKFIQKMLDKMPTLTKIKSPNVAALLGLAFGGIGLGLYLQSFADFVIPIGIAIAVGVIAQNSGGVDGVGWIAGAIIASLWGFFRVENSNLRLTAQRNPTSSLKP